MDLVASDGNGNTLLKGKPYHWGIGVIVTIAIFIATVIYASGSKVTTISHNKEDLCKLEKRIEKLEDIYSKVNQIEILTIMLCEQSGITVPKRQ